MTKMLRLLLLSLLFPFCISAQYDGNTTPTYEELVQIYSQLAKDHEEIELYNMGQSDYGLPIYLCVVNGAKDSLSTFAKSKNGTTILVNNAIHPGEPDGVNACLLWINDWIETGKDTTNMPVIGIIPAYNIGGMHNRSGTSRANQQGPEEYGFRGNARNLDLNRDCIKMDSKNMWTLATIVHALDADVFIDNHVSNGADYQYVLTYLSSVHERIAPQMANLIYDDLLEDLKKKCKKKNVDLFPYVDLYGATPDSGIVVFNDLPRYASGYASLFNTLSFTVETHMLKPFPERVKATKLFLEGVIDWTSRHRSLIELTRNVSVQHFDENQYFYYNFGLNDRKELIDFKGYEAEFPMSEVTGLNRIYYNHDKPYNKLINYYKFYEAKDSIRIPEYIVLGAQNSEVIDRLRINGVEMEIIERDTIIELEQFQIEDYQSTKVPYEGHFLHTETSSKLISGIVQLKKGDVRILLNQTRRNFIMSVLVPSAEDSYFNWNFYDSYLQQKEYFSPYVFEEKALELLEENPSLKREFNAEREKSEVFRNSQWLQLKFIYSRSPYFEPTFQKIPVYFKY